MSILTTPNDVLRVSAAPVELDVEGLAEATSVIASLVEHAEGVPNDGAAGLAAPQIGVSLRIFIFRRAGHWQEMINPVILRYGPRKNVALEGCLSLPGVKVAVERPMSIAVSYVTGAGHEDFETFGQPLARVVQHEYDHLDGKLITDYGPAAQIRSA